MAGIAGCWTTIFNEKQWSQWYIYWFPTHTRSHKKLKISVLWLCSIQYNTVAMVCFQLKKDLVLVFFCIFSMMTTKVPTNRKKIRMNVEKTEEECDFWNKSVVTIKIRVFMYICVVCMYMYRLHLSLFVVFFACFLFRESRLLPLNSWFTTTFLMVVYCKFNDV